MAFAQAREEIPSASSTVPRIAREMVTAAAVFNRVHAPEAEWPVSFRCASDQADETTDGFESGDIREFVSPSDSPKVNLSTALQDG